ncbi:MAG: hypothetical protein P8O86_10115 [Actinomycetota bacterium]|nr:hypothetical protein [Actinomycetota bacterium]MDG2119738.1 hypothetical protein [Actinomycetota bacterium]
MAQRCLAFFVVALIATACVESTNEAQVLEEPGVGSVSSPPLLQKPAPASASRELEKTIASIPYELQQLEQVTLSGQRFDVGSVIGKDIILWFWAPW